MRAMDLVVPGEKAFVVFTRDMHFEHDYAGNGFTGYWIAGTNSIEQIDKVVVYLQNPITGKNEIYGGRYSHWEESPREGRKIIHFTGLEFKGLTDSNWIEFGGNGWSPTFYIPKVSKW